MVGKTVFVKNPAFSRFKGRFHLATRCCSPSFNQTFGRNAVNKEYDKRLTIWKSRVAVNILDVLPTPLLILFAKNAVLASDDLLIELASLVVTSSLTKYLKSLETTRPSSHIVYPDLCTAPVQLKQRL